MLDIKAIRENPEEIERRLRTREPEASVKPVLELDEQRRAMIAEVEQLKAKRNDVSSKVGEFKRDGKHDEAEGLIQEIGQVADQIKDMDVKLRDVEANLDDLLARMSNLPHESVPVSLDKEDKITVREHGEKPQFDHEIEHHLDFCEKLGMLDFPRGAQMAGSRFPLYKGWGARLEMGLIQFFWNFHADRGYTHIFPPFLGNATSMYTASQLPKFKDDVYYLERDDLYLNPTSETLLCNLHRDEILEADQLPLKYVGYTTCFRREGGAAGEEERGLIRMHQFNKVELFKFTDAESSFDELESLVLDAEAVLQALGLHYRTVLLPTGDMAGQSVKTYDIEMWIPGQNRYYEVSSVSNCTDYQARRGNIRYRPEPKAKPEFMHTLNGSGLASSRVFAAIVETFQQPDGSIVLPEALHSYVGTDVIKL
jgi:seryl-tRNA synthetase